MEYRINGFDQIKAFYSIVFEQKYNIKPQHVSLYVFLINQNNRNNWVEWFKCPYDLAMAGACIGNKRTYYKCLDDLQEWKLIKYEKGVNNWKAPKIKLEVLMCTSTNTASVPQSEPLLQQAVPPLPTQLLPLIYKHITNKLYNLKQLIELRDFLTNHINKDNIQEKTLKNFQEIKKETLEAFSFIEQLQRESKQSQEIVIEFINKCFDEFEVCDDINRNKKDYRTHILNKIKKEKDSEPETLNESFINKPKGKHALDLS